MRSGLSFTAVSGLVALAVALLGGAWAAGPGRGAVWVGVGIAFAAQAVLFWLLFVGAFRSRRVAAHLLGMLGRLLVFGLAALVWVPRAGLEPAPTLFALVTVFFVTTLLEPLFVDPNLSKGR